MPLTAVNNATIGTQQKRDVVWINPNQVVRVEKVGPELTEIHMTDGPGIKVQEPAEEVAKRISDLVGVNLSATPSA